MTKIDIYITDLKEEKQKELIEAMNGENGNYDVFPIATVSIENDDIKEEDHE